MLAQQPVSGAISDILELQPAFSFDLTFVGESGVRGCVGDFNNDGIDDFIVTGLHNVGTDTERVMKSFFRVYLGQREDIPLLAYQDDDFGLGETALLIARNFLMVRGWLLFKEVPMVTGLILLKLIFIS